MDRLADIAARLQAGSTVEDVTVREFLWWFGAQRRSYWNVEKIQEQLSAHSLQTHPSFISQYIYGPINFIHTPSDRIGHFRDVEESSVVEPEDCDDLPAWISRDPTYSISKLASANKNVISVRPDSSLAEIITVMLSNDFSQVPVISGTRTIKGVVTWKSISSKILLGGDADTASQVMTKPQEISLDASIFDAIPIIENSQYVIVKGSDGGISGIVTGSDLSLQFKGLAEPFLLIGEIENLVRTLIGSKFTLAELLSVMDDRDEAREITDASSLTFGEYVRLFEHPDRWAKIGLKIDRAQFCKGLDEIRRIRNDVMHFDPDGVPSDDMLLLRNFANFLKQLQMISAEV